MATPNGAPDTIVLVHGLWLTPRSWEHWIERYKSRRYRVLAPSWPGMESEVEALNADPSPIASLTVEQIVDHYESIIIDLERAPIVMGHSFGGTFAQILLDRGLGAAGVGVASATVKGVRDLPLSTIKVASPALSPFKRDEAVPLTAKEFHYAFANTLTREESDALHARYAVPAAGGVLKEYAFANFHRDAPTKVDFKREGRAPLLFIGFGDDHVMPPKVVRHNEEKYDDSNGIIEFKEFPGRPHFPGAPGWEEVADYALAWAIEHASTRPVLA
ncbi:MAG TPA: alpha/beta hydrolase, partial [Gaiellaceae bacterium]|nr:alpha/beta hydrolase [Gaiellaceae bacterium]